MHKTWRQHYQPIIADLIAKHKDLPTKELKKILCKANPGQYGHHKKVWANEYMRQLGLSKKRSTYIRPLQQITIWP